MWRIDPLRHANKEGCQISLGAHFHGPTQLGFVELTLGAAAIAGIKRDGMLNFMTSDELLSWIANVRGAKRRSHIQRRQSGSGAVS